MFLVLRSSQQLFEQALCLLFGTRWFVVKADGKGIRAKEVVSMSQASTECAHSAEDVDEQPVLPTVSVSNVCACRLSMDIEPCATSA